MANQTISDTDLVEKLFEVFRTYGFDSATITELSAATGLKKSSLYHRFPAGKDDMVKAVVAHISELLDRQLIQPLLNSKMSPEQRFDEMITTIVAFYHDGSKNCLFNVLGIGDVKREINLVLHKDYVGWRDALTQLAAEMGVSTKEAEQRAVHFLVTVQGGLVIQRLTNDSEMFSASLLFAKKIFFEKVN